MITINFFLPVPSGPPVNVTVEAESSTDIFIAWQPPENLKQNGIIVGYKIQINPGDGTSLIREHSVTADVTNLSVTGKRNDKLYYRYASRSIIIIIMLRFGEIHKLYGVCGGWHFPWLWSILYSNSSENIGRWYECQDAVVMANTKL